MSSDIVRENLQFVLTGIPQSELSRRSGGIPTQQHISEAIRGKRSLREHEMRSIERAIGLPSGWLTKFSFSEGAYAYMRLKPLRSLRGRRKIATNHHVKNSAIT